MRSQDKEQREPLLKKNKLEGVLSLYKEGFEEVNVKQKLDQVLDIAQHSREHHYKTHVSSYYHLVTDFFEYGWGESFHFARRHAKETFPQSIARMEHYVALRLGLKPGMKVLDLGAGVGGPMREIARFSGANIVGINISQYQIDRGISHNIRYGMDKLCSFIKGDFMNMPVKDETFDHAYAVEATPHAPSKLDLFKEVYRVLKPGGLFCSYEYVMLDKFDPKNKYHQELKKGIEVNGGLQDTPHYSVSIDCFKKAGFELLEAQDLAAIDEQNPIPWYDCLDGKFSISGFRYTRVGRWLTEMMVGVLEKLKIAPQGARDTAHMLNECARCCVEAGKLGIFTPNFFILGRKPEKKK